MTHTSTPTQNERRAGPMSFFALAVLVVSIGAMTYVLERRDMVLHDLALSAPPPVEQSIVVFNEQRDAGFAREVRIRAQVDFTRKVTLGVGGLLGTPEFTLLPLYPESASGETPPQALGVLMLDGPLSSMTEARLNHLMSDIRDVGAFGPILALHGTAGGVPALNPIVPRLLANADRQIASQALYMRPFELGREVAFAPKPVGASLILSGGIAAVFAVIGTLLMAFRSNRRPVAAQPVAAGVHMDIAPYEPEMVTGESGRATLDKLFAPGQMPHMASDEIYRPGYDESLAAFEEVDPVAQDDHDDYRSNVEALFGPEEHLPQHAASAHPQDAHDLDVAAYDRADDALIGMTGEARVLDLKLSATTRAYGETAPIDEAATETGKKPKLRLRFGALKLGPSIRKEFKVSRRAAAKLEADPFVRRLAKMA